MKEFLNKVREFQLASDQLVNNKPSIISTNESYLRYELGFEELEEYKEAVEENDKVEILDSLVDQLYIMLGSVNTHGLQDVFEEAFDRVHNNNMTKVVDGKVIRNSAGKILKPEGYKPVNLNDLV